jgi:ribosome-binding ATPase YchF (GTP1/OBG family)
MQGAARTARNKLEKLEEEVSEQQGQIVTLPAHSEADLNRLREKKRGQSREAEAP